MGRGPRWALEIVAVAVVYHLAARVGLLLAIPGTNASPVWPPSGIALAAVLWRGAHVWPGVLLGAFSANVVVFLGARGESPGLLWLLSALIAMGNTGEALVGRALVHRWAGADRPLARSAGVARTVAAAATACAVSAAVGPGTEVLFGILAPDVAPGVWFTWWLGDLAGMLVIAPLVLAWLQRHRPGPGGWIEAAAVTLATAFAAEVSFGDTLFVHAGPRPLGFLLFPPLVWAAFRFGPRLNAALVALVSAWGVWRTGVGHALDPEAANSALLLVQAYVVILTVSTLALVAVVGERAEANAELCTARDQLEQRVQARTAELAAANAELDAFVASVSHDLRAPVRAIDGFCRALVEDAGPSLDAVARGHLARVRAGAERMATLIEALLGLARCARDPLARESLDLSAMAAEVVDELRAGEPGRSVAVTVQPGLTANGDPRLVRAVLANLLDNAWKFTAGTPTPRIEVGREPDAGDGPVYYVRDNGAGFDMAHADELFQPFRRLHDAGQFPGTGIGLATVRRVVARHGGRVAVEATRGGGATFRFTLPAAPESTAAALPGRVS